MPKASTLEPKEVFVSEEPHERASTMEPTADLSESLLPTETRFRLLRRDHYSALLTSARRSAGTDGVVQQPDQGGDACTRLQVRLYSLGRSCVVGRGWLVVALAGTGALGFLVPRPQSHQAHAAPAGRVGIELSATALPPSGGRPLVLSKDLTLPNAAAQPAHARIAPTRAALVTPRPALEREELRVADLPSRPSPTPTIAVAAAKPIETISPARGVVRDDDTNVRSGPGTNYAKVVKLRHGVAVDLRGRSGRWLQVRIPDGSSGWLNADLLILAAGTFERVPEVLQVPPQPTTTATPRQAATPKPTVRPTEAVSEYKARSVQPSLDLEPSPTATPKPPAPKRWVWPTAGSISSGFGYRDFSVGTYHNGIDIASGRGTPIVAARAGTVIESGWCSGYGYCVRIDHGDGFVTEYGHMAWSPPVRRGQSVAAGARIGYMGSTYDRAGGGFSTGVHLHFTVKLNGRAVNPLRFLP